MNILLSSVKKRLLRSLMVLFMSLVVINNAVCAAEEEEVPSDESTIDSILGALADMTIDHANKIINLRFTRDIREKVCGFAQYTTHFDPEVSAKQSENFYPLFTETCEYVKKKVERNIFSDQLIDAFRKDLLMNGILLVSHVPKDSKLSELIELRKHVKQHQNGGSLNHKDDFQKERLAANLIFLSWKKIPIREAVQQALSESDEYRVYSSYIEIALAVAEKIKSEKNFIKNSFRLDINDNKLKLSYKVLSPNRREVVNSDVKMTLSDDELANAVSEKINSKTASILFRLAGADSEESKKIYARELLLHLLQKTNCGANCVVAINLLIDERPNNVLAFLTKIIEAAKTNHDDGGSDIDRAGLKSYKALGLLNSLSELSNVQDRESARAVLDKYLAEENTRTVRYWEQSWSLGTLLGAAGGWGYCNDCDETNRTLSANLFMPFGLFYTYGRGGVQLHIFDLGQYTNVNADESEKESSDFKDAVAGGIAVFGRLRRYPVSFGLDYTYKSNRTVQSLGEDQIRLFIAMDIQLFSLN